MRRLEAEHDNLRAALGWSLNGGDAELGIRLAGALWLFWYTRGHSNEGWRWMERAIFPGGSAAARAKLLNGAGWLTLFRNDFGTAKRLLEESLALYRELEDQEGTASSLVYLGFVAMLGLRNDIPTADLLEEALKLRPRIRTHRTIANMLILAGLASGFVRGDWEEAEALHEEALALFREVGDTWGMTTCFVNLGLMAAVRGDCEWAAALLRDIMRLSREQGYKLAEMYAFFGLACVAASEGRTARAARLWGISETVREQAGLRLPPSARSALAYEDRLVEACARLGEEAFKGTWAEGKAMTTEQAVEYALSEKEPSPPLTPAPEEPSVEKPLGKLTRREEEIANLLSRRLTNRQIAEELTLSERTVDTHVRRILGKLAVRSREQVAARMAERQPDGED